MTPKGVIAALNAIVEGLTPSALSLKASSGYKIDEQTPTALIAQINAA
jgi:hypothetical protein